MANPLLGQRLSHERTAVLPMVEEDVVRGVVQTEDVPEDQGVLADVAALAAVAIKVLKRYLLKAALVGVKNK